MATLTAKLWSAALARRQLWCQPILLGLDGPGTGAHFGDARVVLPVFQRNVEAGHSVPVIEHNLDVIQSGHWVIDLEPEVGDQGGRVVAAGPPEGGAAWRPATPDAPCGKGAGDGWMVGPRVHGD